MEFADYMSLVLKECESTNIPDLAMHYTPGDASMCMSRFIFASWRNERTPKVCVEMLQVIMQDVHDEKLIEMGSGTIH